MMGIELVSLLTELLLFSNKIIDMFLTFCRYSLVIPRIVDIFMG